MQNSANMQKSENEGIIHLHTILIDIKHKLNSDIEIDSMC